MGRWNIFERNAPQGSDMRPPGEEHRQEPNSDSVAIGRGGQSDASTVPNDPGRVSRDDLRRMPPERHTQHQDRGRTYSLRSSETRAMADIGRFRTVDVKDVAQYVYGGDERRMRRDVDDLRSQGLVEEKTLFRAHKEPRKIVTLTGQGERVARKANALPADQRMYHGFVKPREIEHDADLYKIYQEAAGRVRARGGKPIRVRLDFELKAIVQREKQTAKGLSEQARRDRLETLAKDHGLTISGTTIHVPDIQMEYETREHELERANLELVSENYRSQGIRGKAESGFTLYARGGDTARVRRALQDTHTVERILSI